MAHMESPPIEIAIRIYELRLAKDMTQIELAKTASLERKTIMRYEKGSHTPSGKAAIVLSGVFGVTTDYLLGVSEDAYPIPASDSDLTPMELEAVQTIRRAVTDDERQRLINVLNVLVPVE